MRFVFLVLFSCINLVLFSQRSNYYEVLNKGNKQQLLNTIDNLPNTGSLNLKKAYTGALYCKLASFHVNVADKVRDFKKGAELLEKAIAIEPMNTELRFLRLTIQENAPPILRYNSNISNDCMWIKSTLDKQTIELKLIITNYAKSSRKLVL